MIDKFEEGPSRRQERDLSRRAVLRSLTAVGGAAVVGGMHTEDALAQGVNLDEATKDVLQALEKIPEYKRLPKSHQFLISSLIGAYALSVREDAAKLDFRLYSVSR